MNRNAALVLFGSLAASLPARAKPQPDLGSIKREVWSIEAGLEVARAQLRSLQVIVVDSQAYEPGTAARLRDRAAQELREAEQHLSQLWKVPGQPDQTLRQVAALQDAVRKERERVQRLGHETRAQLDPRPDTRRGSSGQARDGGPPPEPPPARDAQAMPLAASEALLALRAEIGSVANQLESVEDQARKLAETYGIADALPAR